MPNLLSLEQFRKKVSYNPFHWWGWQHSKILANSTVNGVVKEYAWQSTNAIGRSEIRQAIENAEKLMREQLHFSVMPHFIVDEVVDYTRFYDARLWAQFPMDGGGRWKSIRVREGYIQGVGIESLTLVATTSTANALFPYTGNLPPVPYFVYLDTDGDGLVDTFQASVATTVTDPTQITVYFSAGDRLDNDTVNERWKILPVKASISGGNVIVRGRSWMLARPILYEGVAYPDLDPTVAANYAQTLDIYQRTFDPTGQSIDTSQGKFIWETLPLPVWLGIFTPNPANGSTDPASQAYSLARVGIRDAKLGEVFPGEAIFNPTTGFWAETNPPWINGLVRPPDRVMIRYLAGYPLDKETNEMFDVFQIGVTRLALGQMPTRIRAADTANREITRWQDDLSLIANGQEAYKISNAMLYCPWGTTRGAIDAWERVKVYRLLHATSDN